MANDTHPNAYLTEAQEKRDQATLLISEAEQLEAQAKALGAETDPDNETPPENKAEDKDASEEDDLADAENTIEGDRGYDEGDPHRHGLGFGRKNKK